MTSYLNLRGISHLFQTLFLIKVQHRKVATITLELSCLHPRYHVKVSENSKDIPGSLDEVALVLSTENVFMFILPLALLLAMSFQNRILPLKFFF